MNAKHFGNLIQNDHRADPGFETNQHGFRDEVGDETQSEDRRKHKHRSHQQCERGGGLEQGSGVAVGSDLTKFGGGQNRERGGCADAERPGSSNTA